MKFKIPLSKPEITKEDEDAVVRVLRSGRLSMGPETEALEEEFADVHGFNHAVAVSSGGAAVYLLARYSGLPSVQVTGGTFPGVYQSLRMAGCQPRALDREWQANSTCIATALYQADTFFPAIAERVAFNDWCQGVGTKPDNDKNAIYSFYPNKQICGGEGGLICTDSAITREWLRSARNNGRRGTSWWPEQDGANFRMDEMSAALIRSQLKRLDLILAVRETKARLYDHHLGISSKGDRKSIFAYVWEGENRVKVERKLRREGIEFRRTFQPMADCPQWQAYYERTLIVPFFQSISEEQIETVCKTIKYA